MWSNYGPGCRYTTIDADGGSGSGTAHAAQVCAQQMNSPEECFACDNCQDEACITGSPGCSDFLSELYSGGCDQIAAEPDDSFGIFILFVFVGAVALIFLVGKKFISGNGKMGMYSKSRELLEPSNTLGLSQMAFRGTYTELGSTQPTTYELDFGQGGLFQGTATDDDGQARVTGKMQWLPGGQSGQLRWLEEGAGQSLEAWGEISSLPSGYLKIQASYLSSKDVSGTVQAESTTQHGGGFDMAAPQYGGYNMLAPQDGMSMATPLRNYASR